ncbi:MAG: MmgE/PrpD family protein [Burkholderiales bacterium]
MRLDPLRELARFSSLTTLASLPASVVEKARALLLYAVGVGMASVDAPGLARTVAALRAEYGTDGPATCLIDGSRLAPGAAAFANAVLFHARIQDDAHPAGHMGTVIVPAALALAETKGCTGAQLLEAIVSGYEVALRIGRDHARDLSERGFRTTPIYGAIGAAAACARLLELDAERTLNALSLTTHATAGLRQFADAGTDEYPYQAGFAARSGITSALLAAEGIEGTDTALTGRAGLFRAYGRADKDYASRLVEDLGTHYEIDRVTYKPYPGGQFHRGVIRGFAELREHVPHDSVEAAHVHLHPFEANYLGLAYKGPFGTYSQAFFSVPFCAALAWLYGTVTFAGLHRFNDPALLSFVARTHVVSDESRERYKPLISVALKDGSTIEWLDDAGEEGYDLTWSAATTMIAALFRESNRPQESCDALIESVERIASAEKTAALLAVASLPTPDSL